jgi:hypothetical protein
VIQQLPQSIPDSVRDTAVVKTPLPGGVGVFVRWLMNLPSWIQITGAAVGAVIGIAVVWVLWKRRKAIWAWLTTRSRGMKIALASVAFVVIAGAVAFGMVSWHYMMHNNDFCVSCHVMTSAYSRFQHSEHKKLQCHDCHQQSLYASMRQLVLWVAEKPQAIPPHAKVPNKVCGECHMRGPGQDSVWKAINATAGHRVHFTSDSASLKNLQCTTCHGLEVHHFVPVDSSCGQSGCHKNLPMKIAKMKDQTSLHCTKCHQFTRAVAAELPNDSAKRVLGPTFDQCLGCHEMKKALASYDQSKDPHKGVCGSCHNPHTQATPQVAWTSCQNSGCHAKAETLTPFHRGISVAALDKCETCHQAHTWTVSGDKCLVCHKSIFEDRPPGSKSLAGVTPAQLTAFGGQAGLGGTGYTGSEAFSHRRHRDQQCTACHGTGKAHGALLVKTKADCQSCHHANAKVTADGSVSGPSSARCTVCHTSVGLRQAIPDTLTVKLSVWKEPRAKVLSYRHDQHTFADCLTCHGTPVTMAVPADKSCESCHAKHHVPDAQCRSCHATPKAAHTREAHLGCEGSQCHAPQTVAALQPKRNVCLTCHSDKVTHKPGKECAACHQVQWLTAQKGT